MRGNTIKRTHPRQALPQEESAQAPINRRVYIVEGLPGSGKSTTAGHMAEFLTGQGKNVKHFDEGNEAHPADYENHIYITGSQLAALPPGLRERVRSCAEPRLEGYVAPLGQFGGVALEKLLPYKIYDALPWETEMPLMLDKWRSFEKNAVNNTAYVFNCVLLQNPMCETMMRFGFPAERSRDYIGKIVELIASMQPAVVYLKSDNIAGSLRAVSAQRPGWLERVIDYHVNGEYGRSIGAKGFEGYVACLKERQRRELEILKNLPVRQLVVDNANKNWAEAYRQIDAFIGAEG